ncbi:hypothetical protein BG011_006870 [Mortierella polycephala]|uniref:Phosphatidylserine decarboxylase proenzyme 2 n=1 Tax=Mortierella polycephala TaxID=41804 RepID=A0A9P6PTF9_9FUNG|nr:hypothetical protein BG011_006870 [Mortierella polycephala]
MEATTVSHFVPGTQNMGGTGSPPHTKECIYTMRIHISKAENLAVKDMNGFSDPYIKVYVGGNTHQTVTVRKNLNPEWNVSYDFDLEAQSMPNKIELVFWDWDRFGKDDFMGIVSIPFDESSLWVDSVPRHYNDKENKAKWFDLATMEGKSTNVSGRVELKFGFIDSSLSSANRDSCAKCQGAWKELMNGRNSLALGTKTVRVDDKNDIHMTDIPMAVGNTDNSFGPSNGQRDTTSTLSSSSSADLHGVVFMEVVSASDLPRLPNMTRMGFDMDPFVVISFGKSIFRTRVIRHDLDPVWNAKLMFRVHQGEESFKIKYSVHDWDKLSSNDYVGVATMEVNRLIQAADSCDASRQSVPTTEGEPKIIDPDMKEYLLDIVLSHKAEAVVAEDAKGPQLQVRAKFVPYSALQRRFWKVLAKAYDSDNKDDLYGREQIQAMLYGLGSTLSGNTVDEFFRHYNKDPEQDELTFDQLYDRLREQTKLHNHTIETPVHKKIFSRLSWRGKQRQTKKKDDVDDQDNGNISEQCSSNPSESDSVDLTEDDFEPQTPEEEHLIQISTCPICNDTSLGEKSEADVITHIAVCSGDDGFNLDKLILSDFVTEANAQRKWFNKAIKTLGYGKYTPTKGNANIIVQDRETGAMVEEKMQTFVRLGIRLLYKSPANKARIGKLLASMSRKQGVKFDDPRSKQDIEPFIRFHNLEAQMTEVLEPVENFSNFNEFFYRKLKPDARVLSSPGNDRVAVSAADCRMTCFQTISDATKFWIKGTEFTIGRLLADEGLAQIYEGGSLAIFRLAPQDYHRYHIPVKGVLSEPRPIEGEYYTVNPMAIRSKLDVYGENKRVISTIKSEEFGTVAFVAIGAMMVGSIVLTTQGGQSVERMEEHGYFAFGGSTIVLLFEPNSIAFDNDLVQSSKGQIEMLVKVGMQIGVSTRD